MENRQSNDQNYEIRNSVSKAGYSSAKVAEKKSVLRKFLLPALIVLALVFIAAGSGMNLAMPELFQTAINDEVPETLNVAEAASFQDYYAGMNSSSRTKLTTLYAKNMFTGTKVTGKEYQEYTYKVTGLSTSNVAARFYINSNGGGDQKFAINSGTTSNSGFKTYVDDWIPRNGEQSTFVVFYIALDAELQYLANTGNLYISGGNSNFSTAKCGVKKYDQQNAHWGVTNGELSVSSTSYRTSNPGGCVSDTYSGQGQTTKSLQTSGNGYAIGENVTALTVWAYTECNHSGAGGRWPSMDLWDIWFTFRCTDVTKPTLLRLSPDDWAKYNNAYLYYYDQGSDNHYRSRSYTYTQSNGSTSSPQTNFSGGAQVTSNTSSMSVNGKTRTSSSTMTKGGYTYFTGTLSYGPVDVTFVDCAGNSQTLHFDHNEVHVDNAVPTVDEVFIGDSSGGAITSSTQNAVYLYVKASDKGSGSDGAYPSGIKNIQYQLGSNWSTMGTSTKSFNGKSYYYAEIKSNGTYTVKAVDNAGNESATKTASCYVIDKVAPKLSISFSTAWANGPVTVTVTLTDDAGSGSDTGKSWDTNYYSLRNAPYLYIWYGTTRNETYSANMIYGSNGGTGRGGMTTNNGTITYVYTLTLPYNGEYSFKAKDQAGNETISATVNGTANSNTFRLNIDTSAPKVEAEAVSSGGNNGFEKYTDGTEPAPKWTADTVNVTVTVKDGGSTGVTNFGSNIKSLGLVDVNDPTYKTPGSSYNYLAGYYKEYPGGSDSATVSETFKISWEYLTRKEVAAVAIDMAGNISTMAVKDNPPSPYFSGVTFPGTIGGSTAYYYNPNSYEGSYRFYTFRDSKPITIGLYEKNDDSVKYVGTSTESTSTYIMPWKKGSTTFYVKISGGPSVYNATAKGHTKLSSSSEYSEYNEGNWGITASMTSDNNVAWIPVAFKKPGSNDFYAEVRNGTGVTVNSGVIQIRIDNEGPSAEVLGFSQESVDTYGPSTSKSSLSFPIPIANLININKWYERDTVNYIYIYVNDAASGVFRDSQAYSGGNQQSNAYATVTLSHNGYSYTYNAYAAVGQNEPPYDYLDPAKLELKEDPAENRMLYYERIADGAILRIKLWDAATLAKAAKGTTLIGTDYKYGSNEPFKFQIKVKDFVGNENSVAIKDKTDLELYVEAVPKNNIGIGNVTAKTAADGNNYELAYDPTSANWTAQDIIITVQKKLGLSAGNVTYGTYNLSDYKWGAGEVLGPSAPQGEYSSANVTDSPSSTTATITIPKKSQFVKLFIKLTDGTGEHVWSYIEDSSGDNNRGAVIRQDNDNPTLVGIVVSTDDKLFEGFDLKTTDPSIGDGVKSYLSTKTNSFVLYFSYNGTAFVRELGESAATVWSYQYSYIYIITTDMAGGMGSGVKSATLNVGAAGLKSGGQATVTLTTPIYTDGRLGSAIFRTDAADYGLSRAVNTAILTINAEDAVGLKIGESGVAQQQDSAGLKLLPVVDEVIPDAVLTSAVLADMGNESYLDGNGKLSGNYIRNDLTINYSLTRGESGLKVYIRGTRPYQESIEKSSDSALYTQRSIASSKKYSLLPAGMVLPVEQLKDPSSPEFGWTYATKVDPEQGEGTSTGSFKLSSVGKTISNRFELLMVSGTGIYNYIELGDVRIDTAAPVFDQKKTFFYMQSEFKDGIVPENNYDIVVDKQIKIDGTDYTNDDLYAFFYVTDGAAGSGISKVTDSKTGEVVNYVNLKVGDADYETYYYIPVSYDENNATYSLSATDNANNTASSFYVTPLIDKKLPELSGSVRIGSADTTAELYSQDLIKFTNDPNGLYITVNIEVGKSGISSFRYEEYTYSSDGAAKNLTDNQTVTLGEDRTYILHANKEGKFDYVFYLENGVKEKYKVTTPDASGKDTTYTSTTCTFTVAIDRTAPEYNGGNLELLTGNGKGEWLGEAQSIILNLSDNASGVFSSGIAYDMIKVEYYYPDAAQATSGTMKSASFGFDYNGSDTLLHNGQYTSKQEISLYVRYTITIVDNAGNEYTDEHGQKLSFVPLIDTLDPKFDGNIALLLKDYNVDYDNVSYKGENDTGGKAYTAGVWTKYDVGATIKMIYSISGVTLEMSLDNGDFAPVDRAYESATSDSNDDLHNLSGFVWADAPKPGELTSSGWVPGDGYRAQQGEFGYTLQYLFGDGSTLYKDGVATDNAANRSAGHQSYYDHTVKFRLVSGSGHYSDAVSVGKVMIDKVAPEIDMKVEIRDETNDLFVGNTNVPRERVKDGVSEMVVSYNRWTTKTGSITAKINESILPSGVVDPKNDNGETRGNNVPSGFSMQALKPGTTEQKVFTANSTDATYKFDYRSKTLVYELGNTETIDRQDYTVQVVTGSGMKSRVYRVEGIRMDMTAESSLAKSTFKTTGSVTNVVPEVNSAPLPDKKNPAATLKRLAGEYDMSKGLGEYANGTWSAANAVVLELDIYTNYAGWELWVSYAGGPEQLYERIPGVDEENAVEPRQTLKRYFVVDEMGQNNVKFYLRIPHNLLNDPNHLDKCEEIGRNCHDANSDVWLDNSIPFIYVESITGERSDNWDNTLANSWFTDAVSVKLKVGTLVPDGSGYIFSDATPLSGYEIFTKTEAAKDYTSKGQIEDYVITGDDLIASDGYMFKVESGARIPGSSEKMNYVLGTDSKDNSGKIAATTAQIAEIISSLGGLVRHLSTEDFEYYINIDTNLYIVNVSGALVFYDGSTSGEAKTVTNENFAEYKKFRHLETGDVANEGGFKRGATVKVTYESNVGEDFYHRTTEYGAWNATDGKWLGDMATYSTAENAAHEKSGEILYLITGAQTISNGTDKGTRIEGTRIMMNFYFIKELELTFGETEMYLQTQTDVKMTAKTTFNYHATSGSLTFASFSTADGLEINYYNMDKTALDAKWKPGAVGGYVAEVKFVNGANNDAFRFKNPREVLLVKYFDETKEVERGGAVVREKVENSLTDPFTVSEQQDLEFIGTEYWDRDAVKADGDWFTLGKSKTYLNKFYKLTGNIETESGFGGIIGKFTGDLNGGEYTITMKGAKTASYGLFGELSGTVHDLAIAVEGEIIADGAENIGILAAVANGGKVYNVRVSGDIIIESVVKGAAIGGLIGKISGTDIGSESGNKYNVYVNVNVFNNGVAIEDSDIGGIVGYVGDGSKVYNTVTYSLMTVYNVSAGVNVGATIGNAETTSFAGTDAQDVYFNNVYLADNTFVNDEVSEEFMGAKNNVKTNNDNTFNGKTHADLVDGEGLGGNNAIVKENLRDLILGRVYEDFGLTVVGATYNNGDGDRTPIKIEKVTQLRAIDRHMTLKYALTTGLDLNNFGKSIGLHEVFGGEFDGGGYKLDNFGKGFDVADGNRIGLFAEVSGKVTGLIFNDAQLKVENTGLDEVYAGLVAAKLSKGVVSDVIAIGNLDVLNGSGTVYAGAIAGYSDLGDIYDILTITNIRSTAERAYVGGIVGKANETRMGVVPEATDVDGPVFALGRVEVVANLSMVGAVIGDGKLASDTGDKVYAIEGTAYGNGTVMTRKTEGVNYTSFDSLSLNILFSNKKDPFGKVFGAGEDRLYYLASAGEGDERKQFIVEDEEDFGHIEHMLYASYNLRNDEGIIRFTEFETIGRGLALETTGKGEGLLFTGSINGKNSNSVEVEHGSVTSLMNVDDSLVYNNAGSIRDLTINVNYENDEVTEDMVFGAVAVYNSNSGLIRNVTISGSINIASVNKDTTIIVSGFIGIGKGGTLADSRVQNSISGLEIKVSNAGTVYAGGYVGRLDGEMTLSYGIGDGTMVIDGCVKTYAGTIVGVVYKEPDWASLEETKDYRYDITVDGKKVEEKFGLVSTK